MFDIEETKKQVRTFSNKGLTYVKTHWVDGLLFFFILLILGAFDIFVLEQNNKFLTFEYWEHTACRLTAYMLAGILGFRLYYDKARALCYDLTRAFNKNRHLLPLKELNSIPFGDFLDVINDETKIAAWKAKITALLVKLDKKSPAVFPIYYKMRDISIFDKYKFKNRLIKKAEKYCEKRQILENMLVDEYINENLPLLDVKFYKIYPTDFTQTTGRIGKYNHYYTRANPKGNAAKKIGDGLIVSLLIAVFTGSFVLSVNEALLTERVSTIVSIIVNAIFDIGFTVFKFFSAIGSCPKIVRQEDLRSVLDQNEILVRFKKTLPEQNIIEYNNVLDELKKEEQNLKDETE